MLKHVAANISLSTFDKVINNRDDRHQTPDEDIM